MAEVETGANVADQVSAVSCKKFTEWKCSTDPRDNSLTEVEELEEQSDGGGEEPYAVISMVSMAECSGLGEMVSSGSVAAAPRLRDPSVEPTLEAE